MEKKREWMIISGGQTGVDRAALDAAIECGIPHGGFVPKGRLAEDGKLPAKYKVKEMPSTDYSDRTRANVDSADATLVIFRGRLMGGTLLTWEYAKNRGRLVKMIDLKMMGPQTAAEQILTWVKEITPTRLNVAGPRESTHPGIYRETLPILKAAFSSLM